MYVFISKHQNMIKVRNILNLQLVTCVLTSHKILSLQWLGHRNTITMTSPEQVIPLKITPTGTHDTELMALNLNSTT